MKYLLCYFSGTGNTRWLAKQAEAVVKDCGHAVETVDIEKLTSPPDTAQADIIGLLLPVYGFGLNGLSLQFIKSLPRSAGQKVMLYASCGGLPGVGLVQALALLAARGYTVAIARQLRMPDTWILAKNPPTEEALTEKQAAAAEQLRKDAELVSAGGRDIQPGNLILMPFLGFIYVIFHYLGRRQAGKWFAVSDKCTSCQVCFKTCPAGTITWVDNKPAWGWTCQQCYRCINSCPQAAIEVSLWPLLATFIPFFLIRPFYLYCAALMPWLHLPVVSFAAKLLIFAAFSSALIWLVDRAMHHRLLSRLLPQVYLTGKRRRYKI